MSRPEQKLIAIHERAGRQDMLKSIRMPKSLIRTFAVCLSAAFALLWASEQPAAAATFSEPQALSPGAGFRSDFPVVALAPGGAANVAWSQYVDPPDSGDAIIGSAFVDPSGTADPAVDFGNGFQPATVVDEDGTTTLAWIERNEDDSERFVRFVRIDSDGNAGSVETAAHSTGFVVDLRAAIDSEGRVTLAWTDASERPRQQVRIERVMAAQVSSSGVIGPFMLSKSKKSLASLVVSTDAQDRSVFAWTALNTDNASNRPSVHAAIGQPDIAAQRDTTVIPSKKHQMLGNLALSGRRLLAYRIEEKSGDTKRSLLLASLNQFGIASSVTRIARDSDDPGANSQIETNRVGASVVAFDSADAIKSISIKSNGSVATPRTIAKGSVRGVDLAIGVSGKAVACWKVGDDTIALARFNRHGKPGSSEPGVERPGAVARPIVAVDDQDRITLVWEEAGQIFLASEDSGGERRRRAQVSRRASADSRPTTSSHPRSRDPMATASRPSSVTASSL